MIAMAAAVTEKGYAATSVADVLKRARISRLTFYEYFANKEACFAATYDMVADEVARRIGTALLVPGEPMERAERALGEYLDALAAEPEFARLFLIESYAAGPELLQRRLATQRMVAGLIGEQFGASTDGQRMACEAFVGAVVSLVTARVVAGDAAGVRALRADVMRLGQAVWDSFAKL